MMINEHEAISFFLQSVKFCSEVFLIAICFCRLWTIIKRCLIDWDKKNFKQKDDEKIGYRIGRSKGSYKKITNEKKTRKNRRRAKTERRTKAVIKRKDTL